MPNLHQEENMNADWGLRYFWGEREIQIINESKSVVYVDLDAPKSVTAVHPGGNIVSTISNDTVSVTINYYTKNKELVDLCTARLLNRGRKLRVVE